MSILNKNVSYYPSISATKGGKVVSLLTLLNSDKHYSVIASLRNEPNLEIQKQLKLQLPCFTVAGIFRNRANQSLITYSGLGAVDLDSAENFNPVQVMQELKRIQHIAYCGLSCRGKRLFCIIPFQFPELYTRHYISLIKSFDAIGLPMGDNCHKIISQPRFVSSNTNETQFFNHQAKKFHLLEPERKYYPVQATNLINPISRPENAFQWCVNQINKKYSFSENSRHEYILQLARYCNLKGIEEAETLIQCLGFKENGFAEKEIGDIVKYVYLNHKDSFNMYPFSK